MSDGEVDCLAGRTIAPSNQGLESPRGEPVSHLSEPGGMGEATEGGVRVSAQAWWPGTIQPGQIAGDIIDVTDLYTTFARIGGATQHLPTDRIVDGLDQTALRINGDTHGRRDYEFIYLGSTLAATIWKQYKRMWSGAGTSPSGISAAFYDLYNDPREQTGLLLQWSHFCEPFNRMRKLHELWTKKNPNRPAGYGPPYTGLSNARPETLALAAPPVNLKKLPFNVLEVIEDMDRLPFDPRVEEDMDQ